MLYKMNAYGVVNARSMGEYSRGRCQPLNNTYQLSILRGLRLGEYDFVYEKYWIDKIIELLDRSEILLVKKIDDYFKIAIVNYVDSQLYYAQWCEVNNLVPKQSKNLQRFVKEVRCIWQ